VSVEATLVTSWQGLDTRGKDLRTHRRELNVPRELVNFMLDENGHLYMPPANAQLAYTFPSDDGRIESIRFLENPRGYIIQTLKRLYWFNLPGAGSWSPSDLNVQTLVNDIGDLANYRIWALSSGGYGLVGWTSRGSGPHDGNTWKIEGDGPEDVTITDVGSQVPREGQASYSALHNGRRFFVVRGRRVYFSELNEHLTFGEDNEFTVGGDDGGNTFIDNPGFVQGVVSWRDNLYLFMQGSVWALNGAGPDSWTMYRLPVIEGNASPWALVPTSEGIYTFAGRNLSNLGVYLFSGTHAQKVSEPVDELIAGRLSATHQWGYYILSTAQTGEDDIQLLLYDPGRQTWMSYDGWVRAEVCASTDPAIADGLNLWIVEPNSQIIPRKSGRGAYITMGWADDGHPTGHVRFLAAKVSGKKSGGTPTLRVTARTPNGGIVVSDDHPLTTDTFDGMVIPINLRGHAAEMTLEVIPDTDDDTVLIESFQLIHSRKGEKVSRT